MCTHKQDMWPDHKEITWNFSYMSLYTYAEVEKMGPRIQEEKDHDSIVEKERNYISERI